MKFNNIIEFMDYFKDEKTCLDFFEKIKFKDGETCPHCNHNKIYRFKDGKTFKCEKCKKQFTIKVGTIFEGSKIELRKWFSCIYLLTSARKGISSIQMSIQLGITQKSAWFMLHRLREVLAEDTGFFDEIVEMDETYIGGEEKNKHASKKTPDSQGRSLKTKMPIVGMLSRNRKFVKAVRVEDVTSKTIKGLTDSSLYYNTTIYTDEFRNYNILDSQYPHYRVNHNVKKYVNGNIHTNNIENFWGIFKRGYIGIYHFMSKKHLQKYIDEFSFRYNYKEDYLNLLLTKSIGKRLLYKGLIYG